MNEDFLYSRCAECHKLIDNQDYCTVLVGIYYCDQLPYLYIVNGLIYNDGLKYSQMFECFMEDIFKFFNREIYIKCLGCTVIACNESGVGLTVIRKKDFMKLEPKLHNRLVGFSFISR